MATTVKRGTKTKGKAKAKPTAAKETTEKAPRAKKFDPSKAEVVEIAKTLREGAKMNDIKAKYGLSNGQPVRKALLEHGFDSKGNKNPEGKTARELAAERAAERKATSKSAAKKAGTKKASSRKKATPAAKDPS